MSYGDVPPLSLKKLTGLASSFGHHGVTLSPVVDCRGSAPHISVMLFGSRLACVVLRGETRYGSGSSEPTPGQSVGRGSDDGRTHPCVDSLALVSLSITVFNLYVYS